MKRCVIRTITIIVLCLFLASFAGTALAGCPDDSCGCITKSGMYLGDEKYKECNNQCKKGELQRVFNI